MTDDKQEPTPVQRGTAKNYFEVTFERFTEEFNCPPVTGVYVNRSRDVVVFVTEFDIPDENLPRWRQFNCGSMENDDDRIDLGYNEQVTMTEGIILFEGEILQASDFRKAAEDKCQSVEGTSVGPQPRESRGLKSFLTRLSRRTKS